MFQTMILCAGRGTRLSPLSDELPKPLVPLGNRPLLLHLVERLERAGGQLRAINVHHHGPRMADFARRHDERIFVSHEPELLGTAGGVFGARKAFDSAPIVVWNADIVTEPDLRELVEGLTRAKLSLLVEPTSVGEGNVGMDNAGRVVRLRQSRVGDEVSSGRYVGIMALRPDCLASLPERGCLIGDVAIPLMQSLGSVIAVPHGARWTDIGTLPSYLEENLRWAAEHGEGLNLIDAEAMVGSQVELKRVAIGKGATITGAGRVERVVVWPGATCQAPLSNAIVTPRTGVVPVP